MKIIFPQQFHKLIGKSEMDSNADSIDTLLIEVCFQHFSLKDRLFDKDGKLNKFINIYVNDEDIRFLSGLQTDLKPEDVVTILPAFSGG